MKLGLILPVYNRLDFTKNTLDELSKHMLRLDLINLEIILIDDGSTDGTADWVRENFPRVHILQGDGSLWWSGAVNRGAKYAIDKLEVDYIILWNNDIRIADDYFESLVRILGDLKEKVLIGSKIYVEEQGGTVWSMGGYFNPRTGKYGMHGYFESDSDEYNRVTSVDWLTGMGTIIPSSLVEQIGYWNEGKFPQYHGDSDFTYRAKKTGYDLQVHPSLKMFNSVKISGISAKNNLKDLKRLITDIRSKSNLKTNLSFYRMHATSVIAYLPLLNSYFRLIGGFIKWKLRGIVMKD